LVQHTGTVKIYQNDHKLCIRNGSKIEQMDLKCTNIFHCNKFKNWDFRLKIYHLATLDSCNLYQKVAWATFRAIFFTSPSGHPVCLCVSLFALSRMHCNSPSLLSRVARWFIFKPKIPVWVHFGGPWVGKCCYIL
jgi:hypothetical protein